MLYTIKKINLLCVFCLLLSIKGNAQNMNKQLPPNVTHVDIVLLMGQSNMKGRGKVPAKQEKHPRIINMNMTNDGWYIAVHPLHTDGIPDLIDGDSRAGVGPALDFAKMLVDKDETACIALVPCAKGGAWIDLWMPEKKLYTEAVRRAKKAVADFSDKNITVNIKAILWLQGESDAKKGRYTVYGTKLKTMIDSIRTDLELPNLPFVSATVGTFMKGIAHKYPNYNEINTTLLNAGATIHNYGCVDARDLLGCLGDEIHYNTASQQEIGKRMAKVYFEMNPEKDAKEKSKKWWKRLFSKK